MELKCAQKIQYYFKWVFFEETNEISGYKDELKCQKAYSK